MQVFDYPAETSAFETLIIEIIYATDCGGNGGYIIYKVNGRTVDDLTSEETTHSSHHLSAISAAGWEIVSIWGGPWVHLHYEYRKILCKRATKSERKQWWRYMDATLALKKNTWYLESVNDDAIEQELLWDNEYKKLLAEGWQIAVDPYPLINTTNTMEVVLRRMEH